MLRLLIASLLATMLLAVSSLSPSVRERPSGRLLPDPGTRLECPGGFRLIGQCYFVREKPSGVARVIVDDGAPF